ncbi:30S ribosomal protein S13 [Candidatus Azambacteria bacterium]|nr:30S ribosomal protein S13 [Candidatus Azambacteria bacterium]
MPRIAGIDIPEKKRVEIALTYIYGIGSFLSNKILKKAKIDFNLRVNKLSPEQIGVLKNIVEKEFIIEGDLRRERMMNIKRLKDINSYRGIRHKKNLPVYGQRTKTNSRTRRGNIRKTVGSGRKPAASAT